MADEEIGRLEGDALQGGPGDVSGGGAAGDAGDGAAGVRIPVGSAEPGKGRDQADAAAVRHGGGERLYVSGGADDAEPVPQPLNSRTGIEDAPFEGEFRLAVRSARPRW